MNIQNTTKRGFTLLELLIVISIIAILSVILIVALNPAETLKKARDTQRISDMSSLKTAIGIYVTTVNPVDLDGASFTDLCLGGGGTTNAAAQIGYSFHTSGMTCTTGVALTPGSDIGSGGTATDFAADFCTNVTGVAGATVISGTGWVPVNLGGIIGGSPISNLPLDPINTVASAAAPTNTDLVYRYGCQNAHYTTGVTTAGVDSVFEVAAILESASYGPGSASDDKSAKDGGDNANYYEIGTSLRLLPTQLTGW